MLFLADKSNKSISHGKEWDLLKLCARTSMSDAASRKAVALLKAGVDWDYLISLARDNSVTPLLYWNLKDMPEELVPEGVLGRLQQHFQKNAWRNMLRTRELLKLLDIMESVGIQAIPFKGPVLADSVYGHLGLREYGDIDILVEHRNFEAAKSLLKTVGYHAKRNGSALHSDDSDSRYAPTSVMEKDNGLVVVDLHWSLSRSSTPFPIDTSIFWNGLRPVELQGQKVMGTSAEEALLILCMHGTRHLWTRLEWVCDVAEFLRANPALDWEQIVRQAKELGSERMLYLGVVLAKDILDAPVPEHIMLKGKRDATALSLAQDVVNNELIGSEYSANLSKRTLFRMRARERFRDKLPNILFLAKRSLTPNSEDRAFVKLPGALSFLYYLVRPIRLAASRSSSPVKRSS